MFRCDFFFFLFIFFMEFKNTKSLASVITYYRIKQNCLYNLIQNLDLFLIMNYVFNYCELKEATFDSKQ